HFTVEDDGLEQPWFGVTFVNPPYGRALSAWVSKAKSEVELGNAKTVVACIPARTDTAYFHEAIANAAAVFFLRGRLTFGTKGQAAPAPFPSLLAVWGGTEAQLTALARAMPRAWNVKGQTRVEKSASSGFQRESS